MIESVVRSYESAEFIESCKSIREKLAHVPHPKWKPNPKLIAFGHKLKTVMTDYHNNPGAMQENLDRFLTPSSEYCEKWLGGDKKIAAYFLKMIALDWFWCDSQKEMSSDLYNNMKDRLLQSILDLRFDSAGEPPSEIIDVGTA